MKLRILSLLASVGIVLASAACSNSTRTISVLYAGSLVTPMEGPVAATLARRGIIFQGEPLGSKEIANLVAAGLNRPDVVILVDPAVEARLVRRGLVARSWVLGTTALGLGWTRRTRFPVSSCRAGKTPRLDAVAASCLLHLLRTPGLRIARTDPRLDPKGSYTIEAARMMFGAAGERAVLGTNDDPAQTFPEENLLVRLETGEADVGFVYETEAIARHLHFVPLPGKASLSDKIVYSVSILKRAPHPVTARAFVDFLRHGPGRAILERAGLVSRSGR